MPFLARWPGKIPAGSVSHEPVMTIDILPTLARLAGARLPSHPIDGLDIWPLLSGESNARSPHEAFYFYWDDQLQAVRSGAWKLHFPHEYFKPDPAGGGGKPGKLSRPKIALALFNLEKDPSETRDVAAIHPDIVARLETLAARARAEFGDSSTRQKGAGVREPGRVSF